MRACSEWTDERIAAMRKLWSDGKTASEIAAILGMTTRNAVISKLHRIGAHKRPPPQGVRRRRKREKPLVPALPIAERPAPAVKALPHVPRPPAFETPVAERRTLLDLEAHHCRWPYGDRAPFTFCGRSTVTGHSYCEPHLLMAHVPPGTKTARQRAIEMAATLITADPQSPAADTNPPREMASETELAQ